MAKQCLKSHGLSLWLWLSATLSWAKAIAGPSPMAWLGPAETGLAWPGSQLWAGPGKSLLTRLKKTLMLIIRYLSNTIISHITDIISGKSGALWPSQPNEESCWSGNSRRVPKVGWRQRKGDARPEQKNHIRTRVLQPKGVEIHLESFWQRGKHPPGLFWIH